MAGIGDFIPDPVEEWAEDRAGEAGEFVEGLGDGTADALEGVGWQGGANWVREKSGSVANAMGADVAELDLGQSEDPKKLIHGSPGKLRSTAGHLADFRKAFENVGNGLKKVDAGALRGEAARAFEEKVAGEPKRWFAAADACEKAAQALNDFADTVEWAQGRARQAIDLYQRGKRASAQARADHIEQLAAYGAAVETYNALPAEKQAAADRPRKPGDPGDAGKAEMAAARETLEEARRQRDAALRTAAASVGAARDKAPAAPSYAEQVKDGLLGMHLEGSHRVGGILRGSAGVLNYIHAVNPLHPYNLTHPAEYATNLNATTAGLIQTVNDPGAAAKTLYDQYQKDPAEGQGRLLPELLGTRGAGAAKKIAGAGRHAAAGRSPARGDLGKDGPETHKTRDCDRTCKGTDPVDLATGRMYLPQTDVVVPGALPLVFTRRVESGYRSGRWFGPSWSSTADQRLEIDAEGVVLVTEDGLLQAYPHPAPGQPTLPAMGPRHALDRTPGGDYTVTDPDTGHIRHFTGPEGAEPGGDGVARLAEISDRNGHHLTFEYDTDGTPLGIVHDAGHHLRFTTEDGRITALRLAGAAEDGSDLELVRYGYTDGDLTEVTGSSGLPLRFTYDDERRVIAWTDTNDRRYDYVYDDRDRCIAEGGTDGHLALRIDYGTADPETGHRTTTVTTAQGHTSRYLIDGRCNVIAETDPTGAVTRTAYDARDRVISRTDPLGHTTAFRYDEAGRLTAAFHPDGSESTAVYNDLGLPTTVTHPGGAVWQQTYDEAGNRLALTDPSGATTRYTYDDRGHPATVTDALGHTTTVRCDEAGRLLSVTDPLGGETAYERDALGRITAVTDPAGGRTRLAWSVEGKLLRRTGPDGAEESWTYDGEGNCTTYTDAIGAVTRYEYTHFDLLAAQTGPDGVRYEFGHGPDLLLRTVTNPQGLNWSYSYDAAGRLVSETDFDGRTLTYTYDPAGRLASRTNALGETIRFEHDALGRITSKDTAGTVTHYTYDRAGRLTEASNPEATILLHRDRLGRVKSETVNGRTTSYRYDALGRRVSRVTPMGAQATRTYDAAGRTASLTTSGHAFAYAHDPAGRELSRHFGERVTLDQTWDPAGRLTTQSLRARPTGLRGAEPDAAAWGPGTAGTAVPGAAPDAGAASGPTPGTGAAGAAVPGPWTTGSGAAGAAGTTDASEIRRHRAYTYRPDGHLTAVHDQLAGGGRRFDLDAAGRVTAVHAANWTERYAYDPAGNQTEAAWPSDHASPEATGPRTYAGTRITHAGAVRYEHDAQGRITLRQKKRPSRKPDTWRYEWDAEDRLTAVVTPDGTRWRYLYDPLGRRTAKQRLAADGSIAEEVTFTWDGTTLAEQTTTSPDLPNPVTLTWDHDGLRPIAQTERITAAGAPQHVIDARFFAIVTDLVGTPTELVDESGTITWHTRTTLWGTTTWAADSTAYTPLRFPGQYFDPETGLHYNYFRYYDPETARYTSQDPLGLVPAPNPLIYVENPFHETDPLGLFSCPRTANAAQLKDFYEQAQKYGKGGVRELENGRIRFYGEIAPARTAGEMVGRRLVREWDPLTGAKRVWHETLDGEGNVRIVRPDVDVTGGKKVHYMFDADGNFTGTF
ncbi:MULTISPECIES: putative T7SS-secreted protein [Streptomyces]|uniref:Type IV secretion protein Rhs n=1 Tax=Streptomyces xinghaiensis TaxID=1038928 RepID=A0A3R7HL64_9ACTN|nr:MULTISPECIES: DUF6531 domain-containing protein [Streptomyces]OFA56700.1 type IV secretion protein Rhs [Streptomyces fradiae]PQM22848.1 type IV secretion protein Rhs [Streptomyces xinghaiensis]RKM98018.1 type IV secretion protein Rhs [Streptomyces xinghaiensis]RNC73844.1 type IV secretion protein Rhs [Streptomyces xinghaiensis]